MIDEKCFTREWIETFKTNKEHRNIQAPILEKMIHALHLLTLLKTHGLDFVFKGGTSLVLLLQEGIRFSIDIDIVTTATREDVEEVLEKIKSDKRFTKIDLDERRSYKKEGVPKAHYVLEFESVYDKTPGKLLLDVLYEKAGYPVIIQTPVKTKWIETVQPVMIATPDINSIAGDKMTAFAPNTTGIPYYKGGNSFAMEIVKQKFDISRLFLHISKMQVVHDSFHEFAKDGIRYRMAEETFNGKSLTPDDILQDIIDTCVLVTKREGNKEEPFKTQFADMEKGIRSFGANFLMSGTFRIEDAVVAAARVAHLAARVMVKDLSPLAYYSGQDIQQLTINNPEWNFLNKLKRQPDKSSFYYWYETLVLLGLQP